MKIFVKDGVITAEAENIADIEQLLSLKKGKVRVQKKVSYKKECPHGCGKKFKRLGLHLRLKHQPQPQPVV